VSYAHASLPPGAASPQSVEDVADTSSSDRAAPLLDACSVASVIAWAVNMSLVLTSCVCSLIVLDARDSLPSLLRASSVEDDVWHDAVGRAYLLSVLSSVIIIDAAKVLSLTLTGRPLLEACAGHRGRAARILGKSLRKPLRRVYKLLDVVV
jgi:hypothetical protein